MRKATLILGLLLTAVGCASAPGYRESRVQLPGAFRETRDTIVEVPAAAPASSPQVS